MEQPGLPEGDPTLPELVLYYKKLDFYFSFAKAFDCPVDENRLYNSREQVAEDINEFCSTNCATTSDSVGGTEKPCRCTIESSCVAHISNEPGDVQPGGPERNKPIVAQQT